VLADDAFEPEFGRSFEHCGWVRIGPVRWNSNDAPVVIGQIFQLAASHRVRLAGEIAAVDLEDVEHIEADGHVLQQFGGGAAVLGPASL
jgi:hypothetical protein